MYDLINKRFGKLLVVEEQFNKTKKTKERLWNCLCDCGNTVTVRSYSLRVSGTKSCGCARSDRKGISCNVKHGMYNTRTYHTWEQMKQRCLNPKATRYPTYGAVGVTICDRWMLFENFLEDMGVRPEGKTLDRINPFGNYEPSNCRWATYKEQVHNRRRNHVVSEEVSTLC